MKRTALVFVALTLTACSPSVPDSGAGVGFDRYQDYNTYRSQRDATLNGTPPVVASSTPPMAPASPPPAQVVAAVSTTTIPDGDASVTVPVEPNNARISDEQDFAAVSNRQSIESDAERLRAQREAYQVIQPTAVPTRVGGSGPNIVQYALSTSNPIGQKVYRRGIAPSQKKFVRNCASYASSDLAQEAFLKAGGPERDKLGLDPDGDGFACAWNPAPFRRISASNG